MREGYRLIVVPATAVAGFPFTVNDDAVTSPRMTGVLASVALPPEPPHPAARIVIAHATTAIALPEPDARLVKRIDCAPIANTIPIGDVVPSPCELDEGYCRSVGSATVKTPCLRWVSIYGSTGLARREPCSPGRQPAHANMFAE